MLGEKFMTKTKIYSFLPFLELFFITIVAVFYVIFRKSLAFRSEFIVPIIVVAGIYITLLGAFKLRTLSDFGITTKNLKKTTVITAFVFIGPLLFLIGYGIFNGAYFPSHFFYTLILYPIWGIIQQLVFQGFILENFDRLGLRYYAIPLAAMAYAFVHWPSSFMLWATGIAGLGFSWIYYFNRNIIPIGIAHGILGACLYYLYFEKDPFAKFIN